MAEAQLILAKNLAEQDHEFWSHDCSVTEMIPEIRQRVVGHQQLSDAFLLDLAIRRGGCLATFDRRIAGLLAPRSSHHANLEIVPDQSN